MWLKTTKNLKKGWWKGTVQKNGYCYVSIDKRKYRANRLAVFYMTENWPLYEVHHIDEIKTNNKWDNLADITHSQNMKAHYDSHSI
jgi:hypothetical protein